jgi:hypothetical protein
MCDAILRDAARAAPQDEAEFLQPHAEEDRRSVSKHKPYPFAIAIMALEAHHVCPAYFLAT